MTTHILRFYYDRLDPDSEVPLTDERNRVLYVRAGTARMGAADHAAALAANCAWHSRFAFSVRAGATGAEVYRWELARSAHAATQQGKPLLEAPLALAEGGEYLIRCDRVDFPPGGIAYTHTHRGPGIRGLLSGSIRIDVKGEAHAVQPGEAWFEAGPDPVLATASATEPTSFARVMILPAELLGKSSIRYMLPEDQDKPKRQTYQLFIDTPIAL
jgi:quercetin dioxygenase-like cupin family protein